MELTLRLPSEPRAIGVARRALGGLEVYVGPGLTGDVMLLVSELVTNSVRHGPPEDGRIELALSLTDEVLRIEIADSGPGFIPRPRRQGQDQASGWGLFFVERLTDRWGSSKDSGGLVWFEVDRRPDADGARA